MYVKPYAQQGAAPTAASALGGPWREALWQLFRTFCIFIHPGVLFRVILDALGDVFSFLFSIWRFTWFFLLFGPLGDPPGHQKTMKIIVLSSKIKVSPISKKIPFRDRFRHPSGPLWAPFWSPLRSLGLLLALPGRPKRSKSRKKNAKMKSRIALGAPRSQKRAKGAPGLPK